MQFEFILFAIYFISALVVSLVIENNYLEPELLALSFQDREIMHVLPWLPILNTYLAITFVRIGTKQLFQKIRLKIWLWYAILVTTLYYRVKSKMKLKHGSNWDFNDIDELIKKSILK